MSHSYLHKNALYSISSATIACLLLLIHSVQCFHRPSPWHSNWPCYILWLSWCCSFSVLWIWTVWVVFIILVTITDVILTSVFFYSYFVWLVTTYVLKYILFHLCADSQVLVGRPLKCLLIFGFDFWKLLTEKYCLLNNCMAALHRIRSVWMMCTIRSTWMGYTF